ncbi:MAG: hypothetical protein R2932_25800 [Caldilineaceae bacterium]
MANDTEKARSAETWAPAGAWLGGTITALAISPHFASDPLVLAGTLAGIFQSTDGGQQWQRTSSSTADPQITVLHFAPTVAGQPLLAFAATHSGRLYTAAIANNKALIQWQPVSGWAGFGVIQALAISPAYPQDQTLFAATTEGVFRSQDGGASWESSTFGLLDLDILCLACALNYAETELLWAGSVGGGLYRSRNGARSWRDSGDGLPDCALQCLLVSPNYASDQSLYVGTENDGIYRSTDGSRTWTPLNAELQGRSINCMAQSHDGNICVAGTGDGIYYSHDGGATWSGATGTAQEPAMALALALAPSGQLFAGTYLDGILYSADRGASWAPLNRGLAVHAPPVSAMTADGRLLAVDADGLCAVRSPTGDWQLLNGEFDHEAVTALGFADWSAPLLLATASAIYWAEQLETAWRQIALPAPASPPRLLTPSPDFSTDQLLFLVSEIGELQRSPDGGATWQLVPTPWSEEELLHLRCSPFFQRDQLLYAVTATVSDPGDGASVVALTLWQGQAAGEQWEALADLQSNTIALALALPLEPAEQPILLGTQNRLIHFYQVATDQADMLTAAAEWRIEQSFLAADVRITGIVTTPNFVEDRLVYLTTTHGIFQRRLLGQTRLDDEAEWQQAWPEIADQTVVGLHCSQDGKALYAVILGGEIWELV